MLFLFLGVDFKIHTTDIDGEKINLRMWDVAGTNIRFKDGLAIYFKFAVVSWGWSLL